MKKLMVALVLLALCALVFPSRLQLLLDVEHMHDVCVSHIPYCSAAAAETACEDADSIAPQSGDAGSTIPVLVISSQRSGSTWLVDLLNSHPNVFISDEPLHAVYPQHNESAFARLVHDAFGASRARLAQNKRCGNQARAYGIKIMWNHGWFYQNETMLSILAEMEVRVIVLLRRNLLRRHVSNLLNKLDLSRNPDTHQPHIYDDAKLQQLRAGARVSINASSIVKFVTHWVKNETACIAQIMSRHFRSHLVLYEDLLDGGLPPVRRILQFIGVNAAAPVCSSQRRVHDMRLDAMIENYDSVRVALDEAGFGRFFDDDL